MEYVNHGVISPARRPEDWLAGAFTFISFEERNPSGNWVPYLVQREKQSGKQDSMSCVSFSACSSIEIQEKFLTGIEHNYSDRWIAKMSDTTIEGNWLYKVGDVVRKMGMVPEEKYPAPPNYTFAEYHAAIPEPLLSTLKNTGAAWLEQWDVKTEFVPTDKESIRKHLKHAPLQIIIPGHAICCVVAADENKVTYLDTYPHAGDFMYTASYSMIQAAYKYVLTPKNMPEKPKYVIINDGGKIYVVILQGFAVGGAAAKSMEALEQLRQALEVSPDAPTYNLPQ
jgi:hypothetical protein